MTLNEYQVAALKTALVSGDDFKDLMHWALGLTGESGEVADKLKKIIRDKDGVISQEDKDELIKELGDVLWYIAVFAKHFDIELDELAKINVAKLQARNQRGVLKGSGDNR